MQEGDRSGLAPQAPRLGCYREYLTSTYFFLTVIYLWKKKLF
jgi:hypothetical protein